LRDYIVHYRVADSTHHTTYHDREVEIRADTANDAVEMALLNANAARPSDHPKAYFTKIEAGTIRGAEVKP
jgi:hypothetical protein